MGQGASVFQKRQSQASDPAHTRKRARDNKENNKENDRDPPKKHHHPEQADKNEASHDKSSTQGHTDKPKTETSPARAGIGAQAPATTSPHVPLQSSASQSDDSKAAPAASIPANQDPQTRTSPTPLQPPAAQSASSRAPDSTAVATTPGASRPSIAVIAGATLGGIVLLLVILAAALYTCKRRRKVASKTRQNLADRSAGQDGKSTSSKIDLIENHADLSFRRSGGYMHALRQKQQYHQNVDSQPAPEQAHLSLEMLQRSPNPVPTAQVNHRGFGATALPLHHDLLPQEHEPRHVEVQEGEERIGRDLSELSHGPSFEEGEKTCEVDDEQIDRCLSYYMKRRTATSANPAAVPDLPSSPLNNLNARSSPTIPEEKDRGSRMSFKSPKTSSLLDKIRRSQIRLNEEALSNAKKDGYFVPRRISHKPWTRVQELRSCSYSPTSMNMEAASYDVADSPASIARTEQPDKNFPAHWRSSSKLHRIVAEPWGLKDKDVLGTSPAISEPHSAFEYADYYESYAAGSRTSVPLPSTNEDAEYGFRQPWQNHSPCQSTALSPRESSNMSMRQRSLTFCKDTPVTWSPNTTTDTYGEAATSSRSKRHLSIVSNTHRESAEVDEVIRF